MAILDTQRQSWLAHELALPHMVMGFAPLGPGPDFHFALSSKMGEPVGLADPVRAEKLRNVLPSCFPEAMFRRGLLRAAGAHPRGDHIYYISRLRSLRRTARGAPFLARCVRAASVTAAARRRPSAGSWPNRTDARTWAAQDRELDRAQRRAAGRADRQPGAARSAIAPAVALDGRSALKDQRNGRIGPVTVANLG